MLTVKKALDKSLEMLTALTMGLLVIDVTWQVITRFILNNPSSWTEELAIFLTIWVGLLGSAVALRRKAHLGIDFFVQKFPVKIRLYSEIFIYICTAAFAIAVLFLGGLRVVTQTLMQDQITPALGIKMGYVYLALPISGFFIGLYSIEFLVASLKDCSLVRCAGSGAP
jgi:TRAP-type C4-dicarboxylate transport system permease small subunit